MDQTSRSLNRGHALSVLAGAAGLAATGLPRGAFAQQLTKLTIGTAGADANAGAYYAQDNGFFKKYGLDADVQVVRGSGAGAIQALTGGAIDIGEADLIALSAAREHGLPIVFLSPSGTYNGQAPTTVLCVAKASSFQNAKDLVGKTIGVLSLEGPSKVGTSAWLDKNGVDPTTVKFVEFSAPAMATAIERGTIDAATINEPFLTPAKIDKVRVLADPYDSIAPRFMISCWCATADWVKKNTPTAKAFVNAMRETNAWADVPANHERSGEILAKRRNIDPALMSKMARASYLAIFDPVVAQPLIDAAVKYHSLQKNYNVKEIVSSVTLLK